MEQKAKAKDIGLELYNLIEPSSLLDQKGQTIKDRVHYVQKVSIKQLFKDCHPPGMVLKFIIVCDTYFKHIK